MTTILAIILGAAWRYADGRGWPAKTTVRNVIGLAIAMASVMSTRHPVFDITLAAMSGCAILAWATFILGFTNWPSWWSLVRYGGPGCAIAVLGYLSGAPALHAALYASAAILVGVAYTLLHRINWKYSTKVCEALAGAVFIGGLAAL